IWENWRTCLPAASMLVALSARSEDDFGEPHQSLFTVGAGRPARSGERPAPPSSAERSLRDYSGGCGCVRGISNAIRSGASGGEAERGKKFCNNYSLGCCGSVLERRRQQPTTGPLTHPHTDNVGRARLALPVDRPPDREPPLDY